MDPRDLDQAMPPRARRAILDRVKRARLVDPRDPRAPAQDVWDRLTPEEREAVVEALPFEETSALPPEGDYHTIPIDSAKSALRAFFQRTGRSAYVGGDMFVFYPGERRFAPDVIVVLDASTHPRDRWVVSAEGGRGLDFALEVALGGDHRKDAVRNVEWFARLKIPEYFVFDAKRRVLAGHRLTPDGAYTRIVPQAGRYPSEVLGLELAVEGERVRFHLGSAMLLDAEELRVRLEREIDAVSARIDRESARAEQETARADHETARADQETARAEQETARADRETARALDAARDRVMDLCELLGIELTEPRLAQLDVLDFDGVSAVGDAIMAARSWPEQVSNTGST